MNFIKLIYFMASGIFLCSCSEFEKEFDVKLPDVPNQLAATAFLDGGVDSNSIMGISKLLPPGQQTQNTFYPANVSFYEGAVKLYQLDNYAHNLSDFSFLPLFKPNTGYKMVVEDPTGKYARMEATSIMPGSPELAGLSLVKEGLSDVDGNKFDKITLKIKDNLSVTNYYFVSAQVTYYTYSYYQDPQGNIDSQLIASPHFAYRWNNGENEEDYLEDKLVSSDGELSVIMQVYRTFNPYDNLLDSVRIDYLISSVTWDEVRYIRSVNRAIYNSDNPFAEPVTIFTNFNTGAGVFALRNSISGSVLIPYK